MRRGHARRGAAMRRALQLLALLACLSCGSGDDSPSGPSAGSPTSSSPAAGAKSTVAPLTTKPSVTAPGSSPSPPVTQTTQKAPSASLASPVTVEGVKVTTPKGTTAKPGTAAPASSGAVSKQTTVKPTSPLVIVKSTPQTGATTAVAKPSATTSSTRLRIVTSGAPAAPIRPTTVASGKGTVSPPDVSGKVTVSLPDVSGNGTVSPPKPKEMSSPVSPTASKAPTTARDSTTSGNGTGVIILGSEAPGKEKTTTESPGGAVVTSSLRPEQTSPKGSLLTTATKPGGTKDSTTTQSPPAVSTPQDSQRESLMTSRTTVVPPLTQGPFPAGGTNQTSFQAGTKIICDDMKSSKYQGILLTLNESRPCNSLDSSPLKEPLMDVFCKAVKPSFDPSRDACTAKVASVEDHPQKLAILGLSVTTYFADDELSESLAVKKEELEKLGFSNFTYGNKPLDINTEDRFGMPLIITIVCMAASLLLVAAIYGCCHQRISRRKDQQRLTEELQTMENGYHDNPTLEVMETSAEMQEKKINLNGELGDSWIVPMDSLMKEDLEEEEDTHL